MYTKVANYGLVYTIPDYFSYRINLYSDRKSRGRLYYTVSLRNEVIVSLQKLVLIPIMYWNNHNNNTFIMLLTKIFIELYVTNVYCRYNSN